MYSMRALPSNVSSNSGVISQTTLPNKEHYQVTYLKRQDMVVLQVGNTSLKLNAANFMVMHEMMRKAVARLVMQTDLV